MCQMASQAVLPAPVISAKPLSERFRTSEAPSCSVLAASSAQGVSLRCRVVTCNAASAPKPVSCQAIVPSVKHQQGVSQTSCSLDYQASLPDRWMEDCVCDIVRNINEAPFLHMLFDPKDRGTSVTFQRQKVVESDEASIEDKWKEMKDSVGKAGPDGVILVHHLDNKATPGCCLRDGPFPGCMKLSDDGEYERSKDRRRSTDLWGVLVLGKSVARSACYILKTTSVASSFGKCTQFCLTKAKCFGPSWHEQVQTGWLLDTESQEYRN